MTRPLTAKQALFVQEYLVDLSATQAAIRAGYSCKAGNRAAELGYQLLQKTPVKAAIQAAMDERAARLNVSADKTLKRLMQGQEFDIRKLYHDDGRIKLPHELDDDTAKAVIGVRYKDGMFEEYKIIDVKGCCELVGKHLVLFTDKTESNVNVTHSGVLKVPGVVPVESWGKQQ